MLVEQSFFVGIQDIDERQEVTDKALLEALTNTANKHGRLVGQGTADKAESRMSWVVLGWHLEVLSRPKVCETFTVRTWARSFTVVCANRDYEVLNSAGEVCARAASRWTAVDPDTGVLVRLTEAQMTPYGIEKDRCACPGFSFARRKYTVPEDRAVTRFRVPRCMIDCNGHVHNPAYLDLALEALPEALGRLSFDRADISYRKEVPPGAEVLLEYFREGDEQVILVRSEDGKTLHAELFLS